MLNSVCSTEMSLNSDCMDQPHAYVAYVDGEKETVPVNFIYKFPSDWRTAGWDKKYLYKVFWSPEEDDSPSAMLKREPEIPVIQEAERSGAGYYRASVELVKGTLAELESYLASGKRLSIGLSKYKYTSGDLGNSQQQMQTADKSKQLKKVAAASSKKRSNDDKPVVLKKRKDTDSKKKKTRVALHELPQAETLTTIMSSHVPHILQSSSEDEPLSALTEAKVKDNSRVVKHACEKDGKSGKSEEKKTGDKESKGRLPSNAVKKSAEKKMDVKESSGKLSQPRSSEKNGVAKEQIRGNREEKNKSDENVKEMSVKKYEKDDSLNNLSSAKNKYSELPSEIKQEDKVVQKDESTQEVEEEESSLDTSSGPASNASDVEDDDDDDEDLTSTAPVSPTTPKNSSGQHRSSRRSTSNAKRKILKDTTSSSDNSKKVKLDPDFTPRKYVMATQEIMLLKVSLKRVSDLNLRLQEKLLKLDEEKAALQTHFNNFKAKCNCSSLVRSKGNLNVFSKKQKDFTPAHKEEEKTYNIDFSDGESGAALFCETSLGNTSHSDKVKEESVGEADKMEETKKKEEVAFDEEKSTDNWRGISPALKDMILKIPSGPKKDNKFIKELAIVTFGPEVLAVSSIFGTKKGSKAKGEETKMAKPKLDEDKLSALKAIFARRIMFEENISLEKVQDHERFAKTRINSILRDAQKWCREKGYGQGKLENTINEAMFEIKKGSK